MRNLLSANLARLWKSRPFWLGFFALNAICAIQKIGMATDAGEVHPLDEMFWLQALLISVILSAFVSLFAGSEYECGAIRNKISAGHTRAAIYLANMLVCVLAGWIMCLVGLLVSLIVGVPFLGVLHTGLTEVLSQGLCVFALSAAYSAIYCFLSMLISNRAVSAACCILLSFLLLYAGSAAASGLDEPENYAPDKPSVWEVDGEPIPNPGYSEGSERQFLEGIFEATPGAQSLQLIGVFDYHIRYGEMFLASCLWTALFSICGLVLFRRKDLK